MHRLPTTPAGRLNSLCDREGKEWVAKRLSGRPNAEYPSLYDVRLYERRDAALKNDGFLPWERIWLATGSISSKAMLVLRKQRQIEVNDYFYRYQTKRPDASYEDILRAYNRAKLYQYHKNDWLMRISGDPDPYAQLEQLKRERGIQDSPRKRIPRKKLPDYDDIVARTKAKEQRLGRGQRALSKYAKKRGKE